MTVEARTEPQHPAEIDVAALHMARTYGDGSDAARRRWAGRIRVWATRYTSEINNYGRAGRRRVYDLQELHTVAARVLTG